MKNEWRDGLAGTEQGISEVDRLDRTDPVEIDVDWGLPHVSEEMGAGGEYGACVCDARLVCRTDD